MTELSPRLGDPATIFDLARATQGNVVGRPLGRPRSLGQLRFRGRPTEIRKRRREEEIFFSFLNLGSPSKSQLPRATEGDPEGDPRDFPGSPWRAPAAVRSIWPRRDPVTISDLAKATQDNVVGRPLGCPASLGQLRKASLTSTRC